MVRRPEVAEKKEEKKPEPKNKVKIIDYRDYLNKAMEEKQEHPHIRAIEIIYQEFDVVDKIDFKGVSYFVVKSNG